MINSIKVLIVILFTTTTSSVNAQDYCIQFSKKAKKTVLIKEGRNISFVINGSEEWNKGKIIKITSDSLFLEQHISKADILTERESNYNATGFDLSGFRMMAYNNTPKAVGKGSLVVLVSAMAIFGGGIDLGSALLGDDPQNTTIQKKFFKKNVDFDKGWKAEIVLGE